MPSTSGAAVTSAFVPPTRDRGRVDACPGALRPHCADDGALFRVRLPGGLLTVDQARELGAIARESGDGHLDLTSRGNLQLRGLAADAGGMLAQRLADCGLLPSVRHERARNVVASPLCGVDGRAGADVLGWVRELDRLLCASDLAAGLSGRFLFALDDGRGDVASLGADVTLVARADAMAELRLGAAGSPPVLVPERDAPHWALRAAEEFVTLAAPADGRVWRIADLDPDGAVLRERLAAEGLLGDPGDVADDDSERDVAPDLGVVGDGVSVGVPLGRVSVGRWRELAAVAADGAGELRVTPWRGVVVPGPRAGWAAAALERLGAAGFVTDAGSAWWGASACAGRPGCAKSLADVRGDAAGTLSAARNGPGSAALLPVHWSGCERRCGRPAGDDWLDVLAVPGGYRVTLRGAARDVGYEQAPAVISAARQTTSARNT